VLHAICPWCVTSALLMVAILVLAWLDVAASPSSGRS
jgi:hypothetical protein